MNGLMMLALQHQFAFKVERTVNVRRQAENCHILSIELPKFSGAEMTRQHFTPYGDMKRNRDVSCLYRLFRTSPSRHEKCWLRYCDDQISIMRLCDVTNHEVA